MAQVLQFGIQHQHCCFGVIMQGALAMAYVIEGLLFAFHLRGDLLDVEIHTLLVITIFLTAVVIFAEIQHKSNVLLSALRPILVIMQGVWFVQAAFILFRGKLDRGSAVKCTTCE